VDETRSKDECIAELDKAAKTPVGVLWSEVAANRNEQIHHLNKMLESYERSCHQLRTALDVIPVDLMLLGGPPYQVVFSEASVRQIKAAIDGLEEDLCRRFSDVQEVLSRGGPCTQDMLNTIQEITAAALSATGQQEHPDTVLPKRGSELSK